MVLYAAYFIQHFKWLCWTENYKGALWRLASTERNGICHSPNRSGIYHIVYLLVWSLIIHSYFRLSWRGFPLFHFYRQSSNSSKIGMLPMAAVALWFLWSLSRRWPYSNMSTAQTLSIVIHMAYHFQRIQFARFSHPFDCAASIRISKSMAEQLLASGLYETCFDFCHHVISVYRNYICIDIKAFHKILQCMHSVWKVV